MAIRYIRKVPFLVLLVLIGSHAAAQYEYAGPSSYTWKKQVGRMIDVPTKKASSTRARRKQKSLYQLTLDAWKAGDIALYSNADQSFSRKLDTTEVSTIINADPFNYRPLPRYRILEEWTFNPLTGKTEVQITGIAPMREIYGPEGEYRGRQATFWVKYSDYNKLLARDQQVNGANSLLTCLWRDYFGLETNKAAKDKAWNTVAIRSITLPQKNDTATHHLINYADYSLFETLQHERGKWPGPILSYSSYNCTTPLSGTTVIDSSLLQINFQIIHDPVVDKEIVKYITDTNIPDSCEYYLAEHWSFNPATGKTNIEIIAVAPMARITINDNGKYTTQEGPLFWLKYKDVWPIIAQYDQYHPGNSFGLSMWDNYFLSGTKPVIKAN